MSLRLYDTATRATRDFAPLVAGEVGVYLCGLTVQAPPHIGHLRSAVNYDVLRRWLLHSGYAVRFIRNITDIDDKVLEKSTEAGIPFWSLAYANERILADHYAKLGVLAPTYEPRATGHITEMHELIATLIDGGHAYPAADGSGDVYFSVKSFPPYGALSGQRPDNMLPPEDGSARAKRDPRDFALWKGAHSADKASTEPADAHWPSPWGPGRPGWHIECSAMCRRYLGPEFDIHGGGLDLVFPHHENEVAQSNAAGLPFARFWVHHAMLNLGGSKMSKSLGNVIDLPMIESLGVRPVDLRYYLAAPHYRSVIDYSEEALHEAASAYRRIEGFVRRAAERVGAGRPGVICAEFVESMDDDLNTSKAFASVHDVVREGNAALADGNDMATVGALASVRGMLDIVGLDPLSPPWDATMDGAGELTTVVNALVALALEQRTAARTRKDWAAADAVRDQLKQAGVVIEDTTHGPRWTIEGR